MKLPQIQIHSTPAKIGMKTEQGQFDIRQSRAVLDITSKPAVIDIKTTQPVVIIDQSKTWDALNGGKPEAFWNRIYNQFGQYAQQAIDQTVADYNQIGNILYGGNPIADVATASQSREAIPLQVFGEAAYAGNVTYQAMLQRPEINVTPGSVSINVQPNNNPQIEYKRGSVSTYMEQYPSVQVTAPAIDLSL
ncbi:DUF6470 family protein [Paenibacillus sp. L3-i20]|uniref:DUF6470 family protein n=1 Tax=Paenibacillus sp. L3-i20 TaxID=2905833 RepID=UPI001EDCC1F5|nr:DUF6470 family protein [Paenibacillus sp. L3-i20]GKU76823.1 hypothetical protein L3i20_v212200 [Paenibacillus sp. L3-i20]